ncbi:MAG TPA: glycosyltransferase family 9 protein, partial [Desulfobulbaceae bacterium]|nr:glycosyltransferase family 9 protein [Desulfobulbaceae bacterium]
MNVDTMRAVDKWAGIPLTFLLTLLNRLITLVRPTRTRPIERILFIELSEMG